MKLKKLAEKAAKLPDLEFKWGGEEQWHFEVFDRKINDLKSSIEYIKKLKSRISQQSIMIHDLVDAYQAIRDVILEADVES